jgi:polysaccharide biosynthesis/export protein ExoF
LTDTTRRISKPLQQWSGPMRAIIRNFAMALVATAMLGGYMAYGQDIAPRRAVENSTVAATSPASLPLGIGDKLKISFYETIDIQAVKQGSRDGAEPQGPLRTFYQRMDLSGDYAIEQDGAISIPLLGRFQADGRALDDVRGDLAVSFTSVMKRSANIDVKILDRSPIYVVGAVKNPGAYKHVPGMIVLHAVALAGGLDRGEGNISGMIEGARETERLRSLTLQVKQLLARRSRLEAQRDGESTLPVPVQLANLAGERTARTFLAAESTILRAEQARRLQQSKEIALRVAAGRNEVEALKRKLDQIEIQKNMRTERLDDLQKLKDRGWVTSNNVVILRTELSDIESRRQDYVVAIVQAEARLAEAEEANARLSSETTENLANAIATVDKEVAVAQDAMVSARTLATVLSRSSGTALQGVGYEIVRQSKDGAKTLQATETSPLMPGDVLKINPSGAAAAIRPSSVSPLPQPDPSIPYVRAANEN